MNKQGLIDYMYSNNVRANVKIEDLAEGIMSMLEDQEESSRSCTYYEENGKKPCCTHSCEGCTWYC